MHTQAHTQTYMHTPIYMHTKRQIWIWKDLFRIMIDETRLS
jgi:hypothetical protein